MYGKVIDPFIVVERTVNGDASCEMLEEYVFPQLNFIEAKKGLFHFQQKWSTALLVLACA